MDSPVDSQYNSPIDSKDKDFTKVDLPQPTIVDSAPAPAIEPLTVEEPAAEDPPFPAIKFAVILIVLSLAILMLFFINLNYLFGSTHDQASRGHKFHVVAVNYDNQDTVWNAFRTAYGTLKSDSFVTFDFKNASDYPTVDDLISAVKQRKYWGAFYVAANASQLLSDAVNGGNTFYNATHSCGYVWNQIWYTAISTSLIRSGILSLESAASTVYQLSSIDAFVSGSQKNRTVAQSAYTQPFKALEFNVKPTAQASKSFYNTVALAMTVIMQNIFLLSLNGIAMRFGLYKKGFKFAAKWVITLSWIYPIFTSLFSTSVIWIYKEGWDVSSAQFIETWLALYFLGQIYFHVIDGTLGTIPLPLFSFFMITWTILNTTASMFPMEYYPDFYHSSQAMPSFEIFQVLMDVWTGSTAKLYQSLPILFTWWVVGIAYNMNGLRRRCNKAQNSAPGMDGAAAAMV